MRRFDMNLNFPCAASADGFHRVAIDGHIFLNADWADQADENPDQNFRSAPSFSCSFSCGSCVSWFQLSKKLTTNYTNHTKKSRTDLKKIRSVLIRLIRPIRVQKNVSIHRYAMKTVRRSGK